jgi:CelD/BcsL family acetyltransferase involved in cellulose biosynthesis
MMATDSSAAGSEKLTFAEKDYVVTEITFDQISALRMDGGRHLNWGCLFMEPAWMQAWWNHFGAGSTLCILTVSKEDKLIGIAPLKIYGTSAGLLGHPDLCDYMDFILAPQCETEFFTVVIDYFRRRGVAFLDLTPVRTESSVAAGLAKIAQDRGCRVDCDPQDVSYEMELPNSWEDYLQQLNGKQRHEVRRKLRRMHEAGHVNYRVVEDAQAVRTEIDIFLEMFRSNVPDKAAFMTGQMEAYFRALAESMSVRQMLKLAFLELDGQPVGAVMCFDDRSTVYLYNNAYDQRFQSLSVGLLSKVLSIKDSIHRGRQKYDFLKGNEKYKQHLGGSPVPLLSCRIQLAP